MTFFDELKASLLEAVAIKTGVTQPARVKRYEQSELSPSGRQPDAKRRSLRTDR